MCRGVQTFSSEACLQKNRRKGLLCCVFKHQWWAFTHRRLLCWRFQGIKNTVNKISTDENGFLPISVIVGQVPMDLSVHHWLMHVLLMTDMSEMTGCDWVRKRNQMTSLHFALLWQHKNLHLLSLISYLMNIYLHMNLFGCGFLLSLGEISSVQDCLVCFFYRDELHMRKVACCGGMQQRAVIHLW